MEIQSCSAGCISHYSNIIPLIIHGDDGIFVREIDHHQTGVVGYTSISSLREITFGTGAHITTIHIRAKLIAISPFGAFVPIDASLIIRR